MANPIVLSDNNPLFSSGIGAITLYPHIYVKKSYWNSLSTEYKAVIMEHENIHLKQEKPNPILYAAQYALNKSYRLSKEVEAYGAEVRYRLKHKVSKSAILDEISGYLCSKMYSNMCSKATAIKELKEAYPALR